MIFGGWRFKRRRPRHICYIRGVDQMAAKKKKSTANRRKRNDVTVASRQKYSVIWFAIAVFLMCVVFIKGQNVWTAIHNFMFGVFGITAYFYPFLLGLVAVIFATDKSGGTIGAKITESIVLVMLLGSCVDIFTLYDPDVKFGAHISAAYANGPLLKNGGFFGALLGHPLCVMFGKTGAAITVILLMFVFLMLITGTTLIALFGAVAKPVKAVSEQAENAYQARAERAAQASSEDNAGEKTEKPKSRKKEIRVIKGFNPDISVDTIPQKRERDDRSLDEKGKKLVDTYYDETEESPEHTDVTPEKPDGAQDREKLERACKTAAAEEEIYREEQENVQEKIDVDFETETTAFKADVESGGESSVIPLYKFPPTSLLKSTSSGDSRAVKAEMDNTATQLVETLRSFGVETRIVDISRGPAVTRYELQPCAGVKIQKIKNLADDIALNLAAAGVRIEAPIPNKAAVGIEVPNKTSAMVGVREIIESTAFIASKSKLTVAMGKDIGGNVVVADIAKMPHGLIAGATGSGKSVCINSIVTSILYKATPDEVKLLMIDPKVVELSVYNGIPHLLVPVVTEPRKAAGALGWAVSEMEKRYQMFADRGVRDIDGYNRFVETLENEPEVVKMPRIVIIIDELADLMMTAPKEVEDSINRIAAKARAAGIHLLIATQRPSVNVITGVIKANIPTRIAFAVSSHTDSSTILDTVGAEKLLGRGDMLFAPMGASKPRRIQGCFVSDEEVEKVVKFVKSGGKADYDDNIMVEIERQAAIEKQKKTGLPEDAPEGDPMLEEAIKVVVENGQASTSLLQRKLKLGYARAARIVDEMEERGVVGPYEGSKPRKVLITMDELNERLMQGNSGE